MTHTGIINLQCWQRQTQVFVQDNVKIKNIKALLFSVFDLANLLISCAATRFNACSFGQCSLAIQLNI